MTGVVRFHTKHGVVAVEMDEAAAAAMQSGRSDATGLTAKGGARSKGRDVVVDQPEGKFEEAMSSLRAYANSLQDLIAGLDLVPKQVSVEVGLKMSGSAGFVIAKAGAETEMKVALTWEPTPAPVPPS